MLKINAAKVRELFARERLTDREVVKRTRLPLQTVRKIQTDGSRVTKSVIFALMMAFPVTREELILGGTGNA